MYTGITQGLRPVVSLQKLPKLLRYQVDLGPELARGIQRGASIAIDGVCQTVVAIVGNVITLEAISETLERTTLGELREGDELSIERSLQFGEEIGGHLLSGHIMERAVLLTRKEEEGQLSLKIGVSTKAMGAIFEKGYIGLDGSSLTVGKIEEEKMMPSFWVHLIPETLRLTKFGQKKEGDFFNLELEAGTFASFQMTQRLISPLEHRISCLEKMLTTLQLTKFER
jgi:riboflavin synthase